MNVISKLFRGSGASAEAASGVTAQRINRHSNGLSELSRSLRSLDGMRILDLGTTSPQNISFFTGLGHRIYNEDVLRASCDPSLLVDGQDGQKVPDVDRFIGENLVYEKEFFDAVLCWDVADFLHSDLVKPVVQRIHRIMRPKGLVLSFFHTRDAGPDAPYHRYHIGAHDTLELQRVAFAAKGPDSSRPQSNFRLQRVFNNRHIENLFHDFASIKFFLGRDNIREVMIVR